MPAITVEQALQLVMAQTRAGQLLEAEATCRKILAVQPDHAAARLQLDEIRARLDTTRLAPAPSLPAKSVSDCVRLGNALMEKGRLAEAIAAFEQGLQIEPNQPEIHYNLGNAYAHGAEWDKAIACYQRALALRPDYRKAQVNLGCVFLDQNRPLEALAQFQEHLVGASQHYYVGVALAALARWDEAIASYRRAVALEPEYVDAHWGLASTLLLVSRYEEGWRALEQREQCPPRRRARRQFSSPRWDGSTAPGETILLYEEQGYGDALQFLRYVPLVRERSGAGRILLECPAPLSRLMRQNGGCGAELIERKNQRSSGPMFHRQASFLDLPFALQRWEPVPMPAACWQADPELQAAWRTRLGTRSCLRVGLAWSGNPAHPNDRSRSISPARLLPILRVPHIEIYSLQVKPEGGPPPALIAAGLMDFTPAITDFADTAALVAELDLVISVDTAVAHLAGALGKPVWTLLPFVPDWRWGLEREDTPWYPTMRLFRQSAPGDWDSVMGRVAGEISALAARRG